MDIGKGSRISLSARLDRTHPQGIHIGEATAIAFEAAILTHDFVNKRHLDVHIGKWCFIGARSVIMPGVTIGDHCIVSSASVVMKDVPPNSLVLGNPARVMESKISTSPLGQRPTVARQASN
jgi:acetyltransferase-like isoleucine patch superfamily enzyme